MSVLNVHNLNVAKLCSTEKTRFTINGILVTPKETVSTDGHRMTIVTTPKNLDAASYPMLDNFTAVNEWDGFILPQVDALEIAKALPKKSTFPILNNAAIGLKDAEATFVPVAVTDLERKRIFMPTPLKGNFPDFERVIPRGGPTFEVTLNAKYVKDAMDQLIPFVDQRSHAVTLVMREATGAIEIRGRNGDTEQEMINVIMPMRNGIGVKPWDFRSEPSGDVASTQDTARKALRAIAEVLGIQDLNNEALVPLIAAKMEAL